MSNYSYEESVRWMRNQSELADAVKLCYLDEDNLTAARRFTASEEFEAVMQILNLRRSTHPLTILDLGCGNGIASYAFASLGHNVFAVDPDESEDVGLGAVSRLQKSGTRGSITTTKSFAESMPFADETFDVVYTRQAVHHFGSLEHGITECARVLKDKGKFLATREHVISDENQLQSFLESHLLHRMHGGENAYTLQHYLQALQQAKLNVIRNFAHYDIVINHYPDSNSDIEQQTFEVLSKKFGKTGALVCMKMPAVKVYRRQLSESFKFPGRFHTFLAYK